MGYRSDVVIVLYASDKKDAAPIKLWLKENYPTAEWEDDEYTTWFDDGLKIVCNGVKWYDDRPDVQAMKNYIDEFDELFCNDIEGAPAGAWEFVRIGEDEDDNERRHGGDPNWYLSIERHIYTEV